MKIVLNFFDQIGAPLGIDGLWIIGACMAIFGIASAFVFARGVSKATVNPKDAKRQKKILAAKAFSAKEKFGDAAEIYVELGLYEHAADQYGKAKRWKLALDAARKGERKEVLLFMLEKAGEIDEASEMLEGMRQYDKAAAMLLRADLPARAGEMLENAGKLEAAAQCYFKAKEYEKAGRTAARANKFEIAAKYLLAGYKASSATKGKPDGRLAVLSSDAMVKLGKRQPALKLLIDAGRTEEAKELAKKFSLELTGTRLAQAAGQHELAAWFIEEGGDPRKAARVQADALAAKDAFGAAQLYLESGDYARAGELFEEVGEVVEAANSYIKAERFADAVRLLKKTDNVDGLAHALMMAGQYGEAGQYFLKLGQAESAIQCFEKADEPVRAAKIAYKAKQLDRAIGLLNNVPNNHPQFKAVRCLRGEVLAAAGRHDAALDSLKEGLDGEKVSDRNVQHHYLMGRLLQRAGRGEAAVTIFQRIAQFDTGFNDVSQRLTALGGLTATNVAVTQGQQSVTSRAARATNEATDRYVMLEEIGRGGMGIVYKAQDRQLERIVAYKVLPAELRQYPKAVSNFLREARAAASLTHPNIVICHDAGENSSDVFLVMEYLEGRTLKDIVKKEGAQSLERTLAWGRMIASGLQAAHEKKLVHRDIKSSNLMLCTDGSIKIMDFGLAKVIREVANAQTIVGGTPYYMSPEQVKGDSVDPTTDLYSLGVTLYEMVTATVPFREGDIGYHHVHTAPPTIAERGVEVPPSFEKLIQRMMAKDPAKRPQSAEEVLIALDQIL